MKNSTLIVLAVALAGSVCQYAYAVRLPEAFNISKVLKGTQKKTVVSRKDASRMYAAKAAEAAAIWRAGEQKAFGWNGEDWELEETYKISYNENGQKTVQTVTDVDGYVNKETYTWNENGQLATRFNEVDKDGVGKFENYSRLSRAYDTRLTSFITFNDQQIFSAGEWTPSNNYKQTITRNETGNITLMERSVYFQGIYDPTYRLSISYGEDGKANMMVAEELTYNYETGEYIWVETVRYTDIEWEMTNGQIVGIEEVDDLFIGDNKIKSAIVTIEGMSEYLNVDYNGDSFVATMTIGEDNGMKIRMTIAYDVMDFDGVPEQLNHGFEIVQTTEILMMGMVMATQVMSQTCIYDPNDLIILELVQSGEGESSNIESMVEGEVEYDEENGYPLSWTVREYDPDMDVMVESFHAEYSDYINCSSTGISDTMVEQEASVYYNLQGQRVQYPADGIFIKVNGNKAKKVMIR